MINTLKKIIKFFLPLKFRRSLIKKVNNFVYFNGFYKARPKVYAVEKNGKKDRNTSRYIYT